jgi:hypothetical protein
MRGLATKRGVRVPSQWTPRGEFGRPTSRSPKEKAGFAFENGYESATVAEWWEYALGVWSWHIGQGSFVRSSRMVII